MEFLETQVGIAADQWTMAIGVDEPRGTIIYCYLDRNREPERVAADAKKLLKRVAKEKNTAVIPVIIVLLYDDNGNLGKYLAEYEILGDSLTVEDRNRFKNLIDVHREKSVKMIRDRIDELIKERRYITGMPNDIEAKRLAGFGSELLAGIYKKPLPFPFDGFTTARGNAAVTCHELMMLMFQSKLDFDVIQSKKTSEQNRIRSVLIDSWDIFSGTGKITRRPKQDVVKAIFHNWDQILNSSDKHMVVGHVLQEICLPPYGANIASAGLLFAIFVSSRIGDLTLMVGEQQFDIGTWFQQNGFKGKYLSLDQLSNVELTRVGEEAEEWNILMDEWEQTEEYLSHLDYYDRYCKLNKRIPVPPKIQYRVERLIDLAKQAEKKLQDNEWNKIENHKNLAGVIWGAAELESYV
jgi:hypothetical protein